MKKYTNKKQKKIKKVHTILELKIEGIEHIKISGNITPKEYTFLWDLIELVFKVPHNGDFEYKKAEKKANSKIRKAVEIFTKEVSD